jgi:hypothetical protein
MYKIALLALTLLAPVVLTAGCGNKKPTTGPTDNAADAELIGTWFEDDGAKTIITLVDGQAKVTSIIDGDTEVFTVKRSGWDGGSFTWDYHVPSTGYNVHIVVQGIEGKVMTTSWSNDHDANGYETLTKH